MGKKCMKKTSSASDALIQSVDENSVSKVRSDKSAQRPRSMPPFNRSKEPTEDKVEASQNKPCPDIQNAISKDLSPSPEKGNEIILRKPLEEKVNNHHVEEPTKKLQPASKEKENGQKPTQKPSATQSKSKGTKTLPNQRPLTNQSKLTQFFVVRRSERKPKQESEAVMKKMIEERLLSDSDEGLGLEIKEVPEKGRGIFASQIFFKGDFVIEYAGDLIDVKDAIKREGEYSMDLTKGCYMYYFKVNSKDYCIDATKESGRLGRLINHSRAKPNLRTKVMELNKTPRLILVANREIAVGEELLYDYGDRSKASLDAHPWLAL